MTEKQYIMPSMRVKVVNLERQLLAGSGDGITFNEDGTGSGNLSNDGAESEALSKQGIGHDVWED